MSLGETIKLLRKRANVTQSDFAERVGVHFQTVSKWERGVISPDFSMLGAIACALGVSIEELLGSEGGAGVAVAEFDAVKMGEGIARLRKKQALSQSELAYRLDVTSDVVSKWERGVICPDADRLLALSNALFASPSAIYYGERVDGDNKPLPSVARKSKRLALIISACLISAILLATAGFICYDKLINKDGQPGGAQSSLGDGEQTPTGGEEQTSTGDGEQTPPARDDVEITGIQSIVKGGEIITEFGFWKNKTLNCYEEHKGVDVSGEVGAEVYALTSGTVSYIDDQDVLLGTTVEISVQDGYTVVYRYIDCVDGLSEGDVLTEGQHIGYVAEPTGAEYKVGPHVHLAVINKRGVNVDPEEYFKENE